MPTAQGFFLTTMDEEEVEGVLERFPKLGERVRDWKIIARQNDYVVIHIVIKFNQVVIDRLKARPEFLGQSYKKIAQNAKVGDQTCIQVIKRIIFTYWEVGGEVYRGSLGEWIAAGRPTRLSDWLPTHVWFGEHIDIPTENEVE